MPLMRCWNYSPPGEALPKEDASFTGLDMIPEERRQLLMLAESNASGLAA